MLLSLARACFFRSPDRTSGEGSNADDAGDGRVEAAILPLMDDVPNVPRGAGRRAGPSVSTKHDETIRSPGTRVTQTKV